MVFHPAWYCLLRTGGWGGFLLNRQNLLSVTEVICWWSLNDFFFCPLSNLDIFYFMMGWPLKEAEHSQELTPYLFQNDVALYFEPFWKQNNAEDINFWYFIKLKWLSFPMEKEQSFATDLVKSYGFRKWKRDCGWHWHVVNTT